MAKKDRSAPKRAEATRETAEVPSAARPVAQAKPYGQQHARPAAQVPMAARVPVQDDPERVIASLRPHARILFFPCLALILIAGAAGYFGSYFELGWNRTLFYSSAAGAAVLLWLLPLLAWLSRRYTVTTRRLILRHGFFVRVRQELLHSRGYDISLSRGPLQSVFRSGDIRINTGLEAPVVLHDVPSADLVVAALSDLMESSSNPMASRRQQADSTARHAPDETTAYGRR